MAFFVKKMLLSISLINLAVLSFSAPAYALAHGQRSTYSVTLNKTELVYLPENASAVVIGNPSIADVSIHSANTIFVVGRGYGETNLIVLNATGQTLMNVNIQVQQNVSSHGVRLYNGKERESYSCTPYCLPSPILGDRPDFISSNKGEDSLIEGGVSTAAPSVIPQNQPNFSDSPTFIQSLKTNR